MKRSPLLRRTRLRPRARKPRRGVAKDPAYLAWLHSLPCLACGWGDPGRQAMRTEAHHEGIPHSDRRAVPLCAIHHRTGADARHLIGRRKFEEYYHVRFEEAATHLNAEYQTEVLGRVA